MGWTFDSEDKKLLSYLEKRLDKQCAIRAVSILSINKYIRKHNLNAKQIQDIHIDSKPIFSHKQAVILAKKRGGAMAGDEAIILDKGIRSMITFVQGFVPYPISNTINTAYSYATVLKNVEQIPGVGPFIDIGKEAFIESTKTVVVAANDIAADIGGPVGSTAVAIPAAIATFFIVSTHVLNDELGDAVLVSFLAVPFIGPTLYKAAGSLGKFGRKIAERRDGLVGTTRMLAGEGIADTLDSVIPTLEEPKKEIGGKRFSTRRHKVRKCRRTRSARR